MNNEIINNSQIKTINPSDLVTPKIIPHYEINYLEKIASTTYSFEFIFFIINIIICISTMKKIKQNKTILVLSIIVMFFSKVFKSVSEFSGGLYGAKSQMHDIEYIMIIITFIIQLLIFVKLVINIKNNKKEENPNV